MFKICIAFCVLALASAGTATCKDTTPATAKCKGACFTDPAVSKGADLNLGVNGTCTEDVTAATFDLKMVFNGLPVVNKKAQDGCKDNVYNLPLGFGSLDIKGAKCPVAKASELTIAAVAHVSKTAPNGKLVATLDAKDKAGNTLFTLEYDIAL
jgi:hypothetical protein